MSTATQSTPYSFYKLDKGRFVFYVDATLLKNFSLCEQYFEYRHIKNKRYKGSGIVKPFPMAIGCWWSDAMELFYNALRDKQDLNQLDIQDIALKAWAKNDLDACVLAEPDKFAQFGDLAGSVVMLNDYYNSQYLIDKHNWKVIGVEEGFGLKKEVLLGETPRVVVYWVGKPDLVVVENGRLTPVDHKTVSRIDGTTTSRYKPSTQMPGYVHSCETIAKSLGYTVRVDRCVVNICSRARPSDKPRSGQRRPRFIRAYPNFTREEIEEWKHDVINKCERIAYCLQNPGSWTWSETSCHNMYMRQCDYIKVCSMTKASRDIVWMADFQDAPAWKPYEPTKEEE